MVSGRRYVNRYITNKKFLSAYFILLSILVFIDSIFITIILTIFVVLKAATSANAFVFSGPIAGLVFLFLDFILIVIFFFANIFIFPVAESIISKIWEK